MAEWLCSTAGRRDTPFAPVARRGRMNAVMPSIDAPRARVQWQGADVWHALGLARDAGVALPEL